MSSRFLRLKFFSKEGTYKKREKSRDGRGTEPHRHGATTPVPTASDDVSQLAQTMTFNKEALSLVTPVQQPQISEYVHLYPPTNQRGSISDKTSEEDAITYQNLWARAYELLQKREFDLMADYTEHLAAHHHDRTAGRNLLVASQSVQTVVNQLLEDRKEKQWRIPFLGRDVNIREQAEKLVKFLTWTDVIVKSAVSNQPYTALAWSGISVLLPLLSNGTTRTEAMLKGFNSVTDIQLYWKICDDTYLRSSHGRNYQDLIDPLITLYSYIVEYQARVICHLSDVQLSRGWKNAIGWDDWDEQVRCIEVLSKRCSEYIPHLHERKNRENQNRLLDEVQRIRQVSEDYGKQTQSNFEKQKENELLQDLPRVEYAAFNTFRKDEPPPSKCYEGTRKELLKDIELWGEGHGDNCIFWLSGMAGTGKSTIARTVAETFYARERLGASFFFSRGRGRRAEATAFFTTLALQLTETLPEIKPHICRAIERHHKISEESLSSQWDSLILQPLSELGDSLLTPLSMVLVVDALDECKGVDYVREILQLLSRASDLKFIRLRILVTSRSESYIQSSFERIPKISHHNLMLDSALDGRTERDISMFLRHALAEVARTRYLENWPLEEEIQGLVQRAGRLFIYAATVCRYLQNSPLPKKRLPEMLNSNFSGHSSTKVLDDMYMLVLRQPFINCSDEDRDDLVGLFKQIVGSIVILSETFSSDNLAELLNVSTHEIFTTLNPLRSVMNVPNDIKSPIETIHLSFQDFLLDEKRCIDSRLWVDREEMHNNLFTSCLNLMSKHLKRDMCQLQRPGTLVSEIERNTIDRYFSPAVQYACRYYITHLQGTKISLYHCEQLHMFLRKHFLHWLEALSLIGKVPDAVRALGLLETRIDPKENPHCHTFVNDAKGFLLFNRSIIEEAPLQIYCSALIFSKQHSLVRKQFEKEMPDWMEILPEVLPEWSLLQHAINDINFAPDGKMIASGSGDKKVRLWDTATGAIKHTLEGHKDWVNSVTFSRDGRIVASASSDRTIRFWDTATGHNQQILEGHKERIRSLAFSPDSKILASGSTDRTIRLWNVVTGCILRTLEGHKNEVTAVGFSSNGNTIVSASCDRTIRFWDTATGCNRQILEGHIDRVNAVTFSPDNKMIASASDNGQILLWNVGISSAKKGFESHTGWVHDVAFSPDGKMIASASNDKTARLWDIATGVSKTLKGHKDWVTAISFSKDGKMVASASYDGTIRLYDIETGAFIKVLKDSQGSEMLFSTEGPYIEIDTGLPSIQLNPTDNFTSKLKPLFLKGHWVAYKGENLLWLPPYYRPS